MNCKPEWFMTFDDDEIGLGGKYHLSTHGCGCCCSYETLTPEEYKELLELCIQDLEERIKRIKI